VDVVKSFTTTAAARADGGKCLIEAPWLVNGGHGASFRQLFEHTHVDGAQLERLATAGHQPLPPPRARHDAARRRPRVLEAHEGPRCAALERLREQVRPAYLSSPGATAPATHGHSTASQYSHPPPITLGQS
jgi:hypothetical protein